MKLTFTILFFLILQHVHSQIKKENPFFFKDSQDAKVTGIQLTKLGKYYYDNDWNAGNITFNNGEVLRGYYMKYDLIRSYLEVIVNREIMAFTKDQVKSFEWFDAKELKSTKFINRSEIGFDADLPYFLEVLASGKVDLLKSKNVVAINKGSAPSLINDTTKDTQVFEEHYLARENEVENIVNGRRRNLDFFDSPELESYVKDESLNFNNANDLVEIVKFYNRNQIN